MKNALARMRTSDDLRIRDKLRATQEVLGWREAELLALKGPCSNTRCRLHYAHSGPCEDTTNAS